MSDIVFVASIIVCWELGKHTIWMLGQILGPTLNTMFGDWADRNGIRLRDWYERKMRARREP